MTPRVPLIAIVTAILSLLLVADAVSLPWEKEAPSPGEAAARERAERTYDVIAAAQRVYHQRFKDTGLPLTSQTLAFVPHHAIEGLVKAATEGDPAVIGFATIDTRRDGTGPAIADDDLEALDFFRRHPGETAFFKPFGSGESAYFLYARPVRIDAYCLTCHGAESMAPPYLRADQGVTPALAAGDVRAVHRLRLAAGAIEKTRLEHRLLDAAPPYVAAWLAAILAIVLLVRPQPANAPSKAEEEAP